MKLNPNHILYKLGIGESFCFWDKEVSFFIVVTKKCNYKQIDTFDYVKIKNLWSPKISEFKKCKLQVGGKIWNTYNKRWAPRDIS